jgi:flagellar hook-associated protein 3 FlgL
MRVTDLTKHNAVVRNMNQASEQMATLQENMSTGRRINKLSDDPVGATQVQDFKTKLSFFDMIKRNIQNNYILLDRYESELADIGDMLQRAKTLILAQANANADQATRQVTAEELQSIIDELIHAGNAKMGKLFIFSGTETLTEPLVENPALQPALVGTGAGEAFSPLSLDRYNAEFSGYSRNEYIVRISKEGEFGRARYQVSDDGGKTWSKELTLLREIPIVNEDGKPDDRVRLKFREPPAAAPGAPIVFPEGLEFRFEPNPPVTYQGNDEKRMVPTGEGSYLPVNFTAREVFFQREQDAQSLDVFDLFYTLKRALLENEPRVLEHRIDEIDRASNQVLSRRADVGAARRELERQFDKMGQREFTKTKELAEIEDLDLQEAVTELNLAELRNQASLNTGARLIQPKLLDFLR